MTSAVCCGTLQAPWRGDLKPRRFSRHSFGIGCLMSIAVVTTESRSATKARTTWLWAGILTLLVICALTLIWFAVLRISSLPSINYNEGWNAYRDRMAAMGQPLYGAPPGLSITNYPFLSFHLIGLLSGPTGDVTLVGRSVALAALLAICALLCGIVHCLSGSWRGGLYAGLCFFLWIATYTPRRVGANDPELLGMAVTLVGLYAYLHANARLKWLLISAFAFALGIFTKHDALALPLAVGLHLLSGRNWRALAAWTATGMVTAALLLAATWHIDGPYFFMHLLTPRAYRPTAGVREISIYLLRFYAPLTIGVVMLLLTSLVPRRDFLLLLLLVTHTLAFIFVMGDGVASNIFYGPMVAAAIVSATAICSIERGLPESRWAAAAMAVALVLVASPGAAFIPRQFLADRAEQKHLPAVTEAARRGIALLRQVHGPVLCEDLLLCHEADKLLGYDAYFVNDQIMTGRIKEADMLAALRAHRYAMVEIGNAETPATAPPAERLRFTKAIMQTLGAEYEPVLIDWPYSLFAPRR
jgi:hypothetical protein